MAVVGGIEKHMSLFSYQFSCVPFYLSSLSSESYLENYINKERQMKGFPQFG